MGNTFRESAVLPGRGALNIDRRLPPSGIKADGQRGRIGRPMAGMLALL
jgi:hypothetical protein